MKRFYNTFLALISTLTSCAIHDGSMNSTFVSPNYVYEDIAFGVSQSDYFFSFGGLSKDALILEAKRQLYRNRPLKENESYANFSVDFKKTTFFFYNQNKVTVSADIVFYTDQNNNDRFSDNYLKKLNRQKSPTELFEVGDSILDKELNKGVILGVIQNKKFRVLYETSKNIYKTKKLSYTNIFSSKKTFKDIKPGENFETGTYRGTVIGIGVNGFIYTESGANYYLNYSDL